MNIFLKTFIPIFVAMDALGALPIFVSMTDRMTPGIIRKIITKSIAVAGISLIIFVIAGRAIFSFVGITGADFRIAGGTLLFLIALNSIVRTEGKPQPPIDNFHIVPLCFPLLVGPAVLTTTLILMDKHGTFMTLISLLSNLIIVWILFSASLIIIRILGKGTIQALSKIIAILLAAIAVKMIRSGIAEVLSEL